MSVLDTLADGLEDAFLMAWEVWWALVLGFLISAIVQAWTPRSRIERTLGGRGVRPVALATGLGAASSSCSYAAVAIARSLFAKGASAASALAFQFASTNLVVELGIVLWVLIGWQFTLAEFVGGCFSSYRCRCWCACSSLSASNARRASMRAARAPVTPTSQ